MEERIRAYADACNEGDVARIVACFTPDAVHYFPPGMYGGPFRGAVTIAEKWRLALVEHGSYWTIDHVVTEPESGQAVTEWTHFKSRDGEVLRGTEWLVFEPETDLISEIRAYYASPQDPSLQRLELDGFNYDARGYPLDPPPGRRS